MTPQQRTDQRLAHAASVKAQAAAKAADYAYDQQLKLKEKTQ